jgi:transcriptional regulator
MYLPSHFAVSDPQPLRDLISANPLGTLITQAQDEVFADAIPFLLTGQDGTTAQQATLTCHVARANPLWQRLQKNPRALVVFQGASSYISPSYYPSKAETGKVVPTWNYVVVQARGTAQVKTDAAWLHEHVSTNTNNHEARIGSNWQVTDAPADYIDTMIKAIVGVVITVEQFQGKFKISQNRPAVDRLGVVAKLTAQPDQSSQTMAQWVSNPPAK